MTEASGYGKVWKEILGVGIYLFYLLFIIFICFTPRTYTTDILYHDSMNMLPIKLPIKRGFPHIVVIVVIQLTTDWRVL